MSINLGKIMACIICGLLSSSINATIITKPLVIGITPSHYFTTDTDINTPDGVFISILQLIISKAGATYSVIMMI